ncbi:sterile alpha motif domain-containing protein 9-like [Engystomops pustulosus]|uniref:sterile alpha motif domain-containing protein 9-like n=1 Tax=Engystomops pustulosus TaxID=76066 RepID=UPI003AFA47F5
MADFSNLSTTIDGKTNSEETLKNDKATNTDQVHGYVTPYPFDKKNVRKSYPQNSILPPESGTSNYIVQVHEFKEFTNTSNVPEKDKKMKFCKEVFRFACACMNARTNGTIHFGVRDKPHGQIIGVSVDNREKYVKCIRNNIPRYFEGEQIHLARKCIRPPRFVSVCIGQNTPSDLVVIEVDVVPAIAHCEGQIFKILHYSFKDKTWIESCFLRIGASSVNILKDLKKYSKKILANDRYRKIAEIKRTTNLQNNSMDGPKLIRLLTGNRGSLDNSSYNHYILITNKCHQSHIPHLGFIQDINWVAVLDFDPESHTKGLCKVYREKGEPTVFYPHQNQDIENYTKENIIKRHQQPSWILCNSQLDVQDNRKLVSFFSREDVMKQGTFLVVFLLLSPVEDPEDPINEVFRTFYKKLNGMTDILCMCENEVIFQRWKDMQEAIISEEDMEERCIYNMGIENINGTILRLKSTNRSLIRFLPSHRGATSILYKEDEKLMTSLDILCVNQCEDKEIESNSEVEFNKFLKNYEERFYRGGKATWWNFYFADNSYTGSFIKRDIQEKVKKYIYTLFKYGQNRSVEVITLYHHPGCGGTTTAMHVLWELRETFRCATLQSNIDNVTNVAEEVVSFAVHGSPSNKEFYPVLLLVDDYEDEESVSILQDNIQAAIAERHITYHPPVVIILNCVRSQNPEQRAKSNCTNSFALTNTTSSREQRAFNRKYEEIRKRFNNIEMHQLRKSGLADIENTVYIMPDDINNTDITNTSSLYDRFCQIRNRIIFVMKSVGESCVFFVAAAMQSWKTGSVMPYASNGEPIGDCRN